MSTLCGVPALGLFFESKDSRKFSVSVPEPSESSTFAVEISYSPDSSDKTAIFSLFVGFGNSDNAEGANACSGIATGLYGYNPVARNPFVILVIVIHKTLS